MGRRVGAWLSRMLAAGGYETQAVEDGFHADDVDGVVIEHAGDLQAVYGNQLVGEHSDAGAR